MLRKKIELLAPGGDLDSIKAAILAGADAIYCGLDKFNARNRAANIRFDDLQGTLRLAHQHHCQVFLTLNILIIESEIPALVKLLNKLVNTNIDGIIIQDLGLFYLLSKYFASLKIHASTQLTTHNKGQILFLSQLHAERVNLSRELSIPEIEALTKVAHDQKILSEVFVHGSHCLSFSGACYMSSVMTGKSGNRGRCSQACRDPFITTAAGKNFPLNLKDLSAFDNLEELAEAGVDSLKIEGRIKKSDYVYTIVDSWRKQLDRFLNMQSLNSDHSDLYKVFNRDFSNGFLMGNIHKEMFIDDPRDHSIQHLSEIYHFANEEEKEMAALKLYHIKEGLKAAVTSKTKQYSIEKEPLYIRVSGKRDEPLKIQMKTPQESVEIFSSLNLMDTQENPLDRDQILKRLKALNETEYEIQHLDLNGLDPGLFIPFKELTSLKDRLLFILMGFKEPVKAVQLPGISRPNKLNVKPTLSILCSSSKEVVFYEQSQTIIYYQLPNSMKEEAAHLLFLFREHKQLIPWFPSIIIGEDYTAAVKFMKALKPKQIVTNNTGIAFEAYKNGIPWIAGPYLNITNSYSLITLKEEFDCVGAFISNELNQEQIRSIKKPENFQLFYSIFHPMVLMTTRQCLFHQVSGCDKNIVDDSCLSQCEKSDTITHLNGESFVLEKTKGNLHHLYHENHFLNTEIMTDIPAVFSNFMIDLRNIKTRTRIKKAPLEIIDLFKELLKQKTNTAEKLHKYIHPSIHRQYIKGI